MSDHSQQLLHAASFGKPEQLTQCLADGANFKPHGTPLNQALLAAALGRHTDCVKVLLAAGADPNAVSHNGGTPLMKAAVSGEAASAKALLAAGQAQVNTSSIYGGTALMKAALSRVRQYPVGGRGQCCSSWKRRMDSFAPGSVTELGVPPYTLVGTLQDMGWPRCHFFSTFFYEKLAKDGVYNYDAVKSWGLTHNLQKYGQACKSVLDCDLVIVPVNLPMHWISVVIDLTKMELVSLDSLRGRNSKVLDHLAKYLQDEYRDKKNEEREDVLTWKRRFPQVPKQNNGTDCGVFTMLFANYRCRDKPYDFSQKHIGMWRARILLELLDMKVDP